MRLKPSGTTMTLQCAEAAPTRARVQLKISVGMLIALVLWLTGVVGATLLMTRYSNTSGRVGPAPTAWPKDSQIPVDSNRPTLVMFAHPHCPCTRAALGELDRLLAQVPGRPNVQVVFLKP